MTTDVVEYLQRQWIACDEKNQALRREIKRLEGEMAEWQRKQQIALTNAYADGYEAGQQDARRKKP